MNIIKSCLLSLLALISFSANAQHVGRIDKFEVLPEYLEGGKIKMSTGPTTTIKYKVSFLREVESTYPTLTWKPFNMTIRLSTPNENGSIHLFGDAQDIKSEAFPSDQAFLRDKIYSVTLDNSKLSISRPVILSYFLNGTSSPIYSYDSKIYSVVSSSTTPPDPITPSVPADSIPVFEIHQPDGGIILSTTSPTRDNGVAFYTVRGPGAYNVPIKQGIINYDSGTQLKDYTYEVSDYYVGDSPSKFPFWAKNRQTPNTAPIYKISDLEGKKIFYRYRFERQASEKIHEVAFYAYPLGRGVTGQEKFRRFEAAPIEWSLLPNGNGYFIGLKSIFPGLTINGVTSAHLLITTRTTTGGRDSSDGRGTSFKSTTKHILPQTYDNRNFNYQYTNGDIIITTDNTKPDKIYEFSIDYL